MFAAMVLLGCGNEPTPVAPDEQKAITFGSVETRAKLSDLQAADGGFGVWAVVNNDTLEDFLLMDNQYVKWEAGQWVYSPEQYWIDNSEFSFWATYPYDENGTYYSYNSTNKAVELTVAETPSTTDFLIAKNVTDTSEAYATTVDLDFQHVLTSVGLNIWRDDAKHKNDQMRVRKVTLSNIRKAGTATFTATSNSWNYNTNEKLTLEYVNNNVADSDDIGAAVKENDTYKFGGVASTPFNGLMLLPQTIEQSGVSLKIEYELKRLNAPDWEAAELETYLPAITWNAGQRYTYNVVLSSVTDITVYYIQTKVDPWGTPQVGGTVIIK